MPSRKELQLRENLPFLRAVNPNYFGNLSELKIPDLPEPVLTKIGDTTFEELTCIGYHPDNEILVATVQIKLNSGYSGGPCTDGSMEYVRFYLDYGDGVWVDHGMKGFNIHDLKYEGELCYAVPIQIDPKKKAACNWKPVLPRVRAILSWNDVPPPDTPDWPPIWGNVMERDIQIDPWALLVGVVLDIEKQLDVVKIDPDLIKKLKELVEKQPPIPKPPEPIAKLVKQVERGGEMEAMRAVYPAMVEMAQTKSVEAINGVAKAVKALKIDISKIDDFILKPKFNTGFEELHCVGLDRADSRLHGVVQIKRPSGYSGGLCSKGSREYIAFYVDFGAGWDYAGTTYVDVHDIPSIPDGGLWYQASLPIDIEKHQKPWCQTGFARIRGILSWAVQPPANNPDWIAPWGDREECQIEIKPLPKGGQPGMFLPFLETIANMPLDFIDAGGYATGAPPSGEYGTAQDSPFGGNIQLKGNVFFAPGPLEYQIRLKGPDDLSHQPYTKPFNVLVTTYPSTIGVKVLQTATGGWFDYLPSSTVSVAGGLLGLLRGLPNGEHSVQLRFRHAGGGAVIGWTAPKTFMVDNTRPQVNIDITSGTGNCGKFNVGDTVSGIFSMEEEHSRQLRIYATPNDEGKGGIMKITGAVPAGASAVFPITETTVTPSNPDGAHPGIVRVVMTYADGELRTDGVTNGTWSLDTSGMDPCGYNIWIHGEDRTIVNGGHIGWDDWDGEGFCLE